MNLTLKLSESQIDLQSRTLMSLGEDRATINCFAIHIKFVDGFEFECSEWEEDYPALLFWLLFWSDTPIGQVVDVWEFRKAKIENLLPKQMERYDRWRGNPRPD